jgi:hypothetical protein
MIAAIAKSEEHRVIDLSSRRAYGAWYDECSQWIRSIGVHRAYRLTIREWIKFIVTQEVDRFMKNVRDVISETSELSRLIPDEMAKTSILKSCARVHA